MADTDSGTEFEVGEILGERKTGKRGLEFLVRWKGYGKSEDSWEKSSGLKGAKAAIDEFRQKTTKKTKRRSSSSRSRSRSRTRSKSRSPARTKKGASPTRRTSQSRKSITTTTTTVSESPGRKEETKETVTQAPGRFEKKTETVAKLIEPQRTSTYTRTYETITKSGPVKTIEPESRVQRWLKCCRSPVQSMKNCCGGLVRSDYPAMVVFATVAIITISFLLEKHVNFENLWQAIVGFFAGLWAWLTALVSSKKE